MLQSSNPSAWIAPQSPLTLAVAAIAALLVVAFNRIEAQQVQPSPGPASPASPMANVRLNRAIELLEQGKPIFGFFAHDTAIDSARFVARSDADFVIQDMEHTPVDFQRLQMWLMAMIDKAEIARKGNLQPNVTPIVRLPQYGHEPVAFAVKQALDVGAMGIVFSTINNKEQALAAVSASRYPQPVGSSKYEPQGRRGSGPVIATWFWGVSDYVKRADVWPLDPQGDLLLYVMVETWEAVQNINEILDVPGVGAVFVGPADLGMSVASHQGAPDLETAIQMVVKSCVARKVPCGITASARTAAKRLEEGFRILTLGDPHAAAAHEGIRVARAAAKR